MTEFTVGGKTYRAGPMNLFDQNIVARRLSVVLMWLAQARAAVKESGIAPPGAAALGQAMVAMSPDLKREDCDLAYSLCMNVVQRKSDAGWQQISAGGRLLFEDIGLSEQQQLVYQALEANGLIDFFAAGPQSSSALGS